MQTTTPAELIGSTEACRLLGKDKATLSRWVAAGRITPAARASDKPNGAFLFYRSDVERLAHGCRKCGRLDLAPALTTAVTA